MSGPTSSPEERRVPASVLRLILNGIQDVAGSRYERVLEEAGLGRYVAVPPPDDDSPTISHPALSRLYGVTHRVVGETLTRSFLNAYGRRLPQSLLSSELGAQMKQQMQGVPEAQRLEKAVRLVADSGKAFNVEVGVSQTPEAWFLTVSECAICADMKGAQAPVCANSEIFYGTMVRELSGHRVIALEVECAAMGHPHCVYRIRK
ncbi:MAG TPA: V4R domain-containing protein [Myxococcaceae bacterium]|nr:V4R domain-containing protein [Myxococcaceae bacterium]